MHCMVCSALLAASGCAGNWGNYNYGPCDWVETNLDLQTSSLYQYEHLIEPEIHIHRLDDIGDICGDALACAHLTPDLETCHIYLGKEASDDLLEHEKRHCHGWIHGEQLPITWRENPSCVKGAQRTESKKTSEFKPALQSSAAVPWQGLPG